MYSHEKDIQSRGMRVVRTLKAPIALAWEVWTRPEHIVKWWGPHGFTTTMHTMDVREGGEWTFTMHGPDGRNYPNRSVYLEIVPFRKIVYEHFNPHFVATVLFEADGEVTHIDWSGVFDTEEIFEHINKAHHAREGQKQNVERMEQYLQELGARNR